MRINKALKIKGEIRFLKLVGVKEFYNITRAKIISAVNCGIVITVCAIATFSVDTALNSNSVQALPLETSETTVLYPGETDVVETKNTEVTEPSGASAPAGTNPANPAINPSAAATTPSGTAETSETDETAETSEEPDTTEETTEATAAETTEKVTESELYITVYATTAINVRSGPGTNYDVVKGLNQGDQIDVIAVTSNGWYKTYNGNYVSKEYVSEKKPSATTTTTSKPTTSQTEEETTEEVVVVTTTTEEESYESPSGSGNTCTITFYGPQSNGDGTYNTSTATGTTCTEGRTCAADWSIYPAGTVIYIENDPLGGDGYYTVEDRGPGVKGYHIDIYADDGETGAHRTCTRTVYAQ